MALYLTQEEQEMLDGKQGWAVQKSMELLTALGELYGAERMIPISSVHMPGVAATVTGEPACEYIESMRDAGGKVKVMTTLNTISVDTDKWKEVGFNKDSNDFQQRILKAYMDMGCMNINTCVPFLCSNLPRKGESVAWGESSAVIFCNSVLGARTNREGGPATLAAALAGRVAAFGYHLDKNRYGTMQFDLDFEPKTTFEYGAVGHYIGMQVGTGVPVITGIPKDVKLDHLRAMGAALATGGAVALFHAVGVTPEAPTLDAAFGPKKPEKIMKITRAEMEEGARILNKHGDEKIGLVALGCPHSSLEQMGQYAAFLKGKKIRDGLQVWLMTAQPIRESAARCGYTEAIEASGAKIVVDTCPELGAFKDVIANFKLESMLTNSAKLSHYIPGQHGLPTYYRETEDCLRYSVGEDIGL